MAILYKIHYIQKQDKIEEEIGKETYERMDDTTLQYLKRFQGCLWRNFYNYEHYHKMYPHSNQPAKLYGTDKTHKFKDIIDVTKEQIKFRPIIDQTCIYTYSAAQVISQYLKRSCKNEFTIEGTQSFSKKIRDFPPLENEEVIPYDIQSLFTNINS